MRRITIIMMLAGILGPGAQAAPRIPIDPAEILEELPQAVFHKPGNPGQMYTLDAALAEANRLMELSRSESDPRFSGYAEAILRPWLTQAVPDPAVLLMAARLRQFNHDFATAQNYLRRILQSDPKNAEALLLKASIHLVRAEYPEARSACRQIRGMSTLVLGLICEAQTDGLTGKSSKAAQEMQALAGIADTLETGQRNWFYLGWGDLAYRNGQITEAEFHYRQVNPPNPASLAALTDTWLLQGRYREVQALLSPHRGQDGLLLRLALAAQALKNPETTALSAELARRFAALRLRGENGHLREEAVFALHIQKDARRALNLARMNWSRQREYADYTIYRQSALACNERDDLNQLEKWRMQTGFQEHTGSVARSRP